MFVQLLHYSTKVKIKYEVSIYRHVATYMNLCMYIHIPHECSIVGQ